MKRTVKDLILRSTLIGAFLFLLVPAAGLFGVGEGEALGGHFLNSVSADETTPTPTPKPVLLMVTAEYLGDTKIVGERIEPKEIAATGFYSDGEIEEIPSDEFMLTDDLVRATGTNKFTIVYKGQTASFDVEGKTIMELKVATSRHNVSVGNMLDENDLIVTVVYTDTTAEELTEDYEILPEKTTAKGLQQVSVTYKGITGVTNVEAIENTEEVISLSVAYEGAVNVKVDTPIARKNLAVYAVYANSTVERITTYSLETPVISHVGNASIRVSYKGKTAETPVVVEEKNTVGMRAEYTGNPVMVYREFDYSDLHVYLLFDDDTEEETDDYVVYQRRVKFLGDNTIKVYAKSYNTTFVVKGVEEEEPTFNYTAKGEIESGDLLVEVEMAIPKFLEDDCLAVEAVKESKVKKIISRLTQTGTFVAFTIGFVDEDDENELPLDMRFTLPEEFTAEFTELYYTPNCKSILARMNKTDISEEVIESKIYRAGTYILVYDPDAYKEEEEETDGTEEE